MDGDDHAMKKPILMAAFAVASVLLLPAVTHAEGLKIAPLEYRTQLKKGEYKKGFIDVSNPGRETLVVSTQIQGFRQVDDDGKLEFFDSEALSAGIKPDLRDFQLGPREALRMYFQLDSTKLPTGDLFGAIFFTTKPANKPSGVGGSVRLGTLFSIVNQTPGSRQAEVTGLSVPGFSLSDQVTGSYVIKNTADPRSTTGFYPTVRVSTEPFGSSREQSSKLVFAGRSRTNDFSVKTPPFGVYRVGVSYGDQVKQKLVFVATPAALLVLAVLAFAAYLARRIVKRSRRPSFKR